MNWQPIESAPRDGTKMLGCWQIEDGSLIVDVFSIDFGSCIGTDHEVLIPPTHWMPLPEPPAAEKGSQ